jgi:hypothetical protein
MPTTPFKYRLSIPIIKALELKIPEPIPFIFKS